MAGLKKIPAIVCFMNYKIYINSIKKVFAAINEMEENAKYIREDKGEYVEVKILIPKKRQAIEQVSFN